MGFVFVAERGFAFTDMVLYITEIIFVFSSAYLYRKALERTEAEAGKTKSKELELSTIKAVSFFVLTSTALIALSNVRLIAQISAGKVFAVIIVLLAAYNGGFGMGSAAGVAMGIAFDISGGGGFYSMSYGFSALIAGVVGKAGKLALTVVYILTNAAVAIVGSPASINITSLYETFMASMIFFIIPEQWFPDIRFLFDPRIHGRVRKVMNSVLKQRISGHPRQGAP